MDPKSLLPHSQDPPPSPILNHINPVHTLLPTFWRFILILSCNIRLGLPSGLCFSSFPTKFLYAPISSPFVLHAQPTSFVLIWRGVQIIKLGVLYSSPLPCYKYLLCVGNVSFYQYVFSSTLMSVMISAVTKSAHSFLYSNGNVTLRQVRIWNLSNQDLLFYYYWTTMSAGGLMFIS